MNFDEITTEERLSHLEKKLEQSTKNVSKLEERLEQSISKLEERLERQSDIISILVCGLFNYKTQQNYRRFLLNVLVGKENFVEMEGPDSSRWDQDPTTCQGDFLEEKTEEIEDKIENLTTKLNNLCLRVADIEDK